MTHSFSPGSVNLHTDDMLQLLRPKDKQSRGGQRGRSQNNRKRDLQKTTRIHNN